MRRSKPFIDEDTSPAGIKRDEEIAEHEERQNDVCQLLQPRDVLQPLCDLLNIQERDRITGLTVHLKMNDVVRVTIDRQCVAGD